MDDKIRINLQMADTTLPLTINRSEEEMVRKAAKQVDNLLNAYRDRYKSNIMPHSVESPILSTRITP